LPLVTGRPALEPTPAGLAAGEPAEHDQPENVNPRTEAKADTALTIDSGWREVADTALTFVTKAFDLWSATDVAAHGQAILGRLRDGSMPCDGAWPAAKIDTFANWLSSGVQP
jgi:hypothetical protein